MTTLVVIFFLLLVATTLAARFSARRANLPEISRSVPASQFDGLFADKLAEEMKLLAEEDAGAVQVTGRQQLLERAAAGDLKTLNEAQALNEPQFYQQALRAILTQADGNPKLFQSTVEYIVSSRKLRSSREFAEATIALWAESPDRFSPGSVLCLAALADDERVFVCALDTAFRLWCEERIEKISAADFLATVESAYWLVAGDVRSSGAGFLLKQAIADVRRELAAADRRPA